MSSTADSTGRRGKPVGRFAPSATGRAHPGTLLAALLAWLDMRSRDGRIILRLEDLDPQRCTPELVNALRADCDWFGLEWDQVVIQSEQADGHDLALDQLASLGLLYPCTCSRRAIRERCVPAVDGGYVYDNHCRDRSFAIESTATLSAAWRRTTEAVRLDCRSASPVELIDAAGIDCSLDVATALGDPVVRRRDRAVAYHLAAVVDDAACGVTDVIRGRDLVASTGPQVVLQRYLGLPTPRYRHHLLLQEVDAQRKFSKFHGAVGGDALRAAYEPHVLCGLLAGWIGLGDGQACSPQDLIADFSWAAVRPDDVAVRWTGAELLADDGFTSVEENACEHGHG